MERFPHHQRFRRNGARKLTGKPSRGSPRPKPMRSGGKRSISDLGPPRSYACRDFLQSASALDAFLPPAASGYFRPRVLPALTLALGPGWVHELDVADPTSLFWRRLAALRQHIFNLTGLPLPSVAVHPGSRPFPTLETLDGSDEWEASVYFGLQRITRERRPPLPERPPLGSELLLQAVREAGAMLLTEDLVVNMLVEIARKHRAIVQYVRAKSIFPLLLPVLRQLLEEQVSIRDLVRILETMLAHARTHRDVASMREVVRTALGRQIIAPYVRDEKLQVVLLVKDWEKELTRALSNRGDETIFDLSPERAMALFTKIDTLLKDRPIRPVLTFSHLRRPFRLLMSHTYPRWPVLSFDEIPKGADVVSFGEF